MSVKVMSLVFEHYPEGGSEMLLALALADFSNDDGTRIYPSVAALAKKTRQSDRNVQFALKKMLSNGFLTLIEAGGREGKKYRANEYRINLSFFQKIAIENLAENRGENFSPLSVKPENKGIEGMGEKFSPMNLDENPRGEIFASPADEQGCNLECLGVKSRTLGGEISALRGEIAVSPQPPYTTIIPTTTTTTSAEVASSAVNSGDSKAVVVADVIFPPETPQSELESILAVLASSGTLPAQWQSLIDELTGARVQYTVRSPVGFVRELSQRALIGKFIPEYGIAVAQARNAREKHAKAHAAQKEADKRAWQKEEVDLEAALAKVPQHLREKLQKRLAATAEKSQVSQL